ncbi:MAG: ABC transporter ATP-binding protein [Gemmatimonadaceae bacterium]|nr:ABC transporter ATP-binding protein [Gemmatimonadaceae bacterium]
MTLPNASATASAPSTARLVLRNVTRTYPNGVRALRGISLEIGAGLFGLLGPNGAGKSSLMRTIATLQAMDGGTITFDGRDVFADVTAHRAALGYLPQDFGVYPGLSARVLLDHLALLKGLVNRGERRDQVDALLHQVNLWEHRHRAVSGYSGGMRQRFGIAQALLGNPRLLIVDEPTAGLDPVERGRFYNLLSEVGEQVVVLLSTHIVEDVRQLCTRMAIVVSGQVVCDGVPDDLVRELDGRVYTRTVDRHDAWSAANTTVLSRTLHAGRSRVRVLVPQAGSAPDKECVPSLPTLEDVYFRAIESTGDGSTQGAAA